MAARRNTFGGWLTGSGNSKGPTKQELQKKIRQQHATIQQLQRELADNKKLQMERDMGIEQQCRERYQDKLNEDMKAFRITKSTYEQRIKELESKLNDNSNKNELETKIVSLKEKNDKHLKKIDKYYNEMNTHNIIAEGER